MRWLMLIPVSVLSLGVALAEEPVPPPGLAFVYAVTTSGGQAPVTSIYVQEVSTGQRRLLYRDTQEANRALLKIGGSDLVGAGRAVPGRGVYVLMGPATAPDPSAHLDVMSRLPIAGDLAREAVPERVFPLPLSFSLASPYGLWNRAPAFAVSPDGSRFALSVLRVGASVLPRPTVRILGSSGEEEWRIPLESADLYVSDLAFSPDSSLLAYCVLPLGDEHTLDKAMLPKAGVYLADTSAHTTRFLYPGFADAIAWGPKPEQITVSLRVGDIWSTRHVGVVLRAASGQKVKELSLRGGVSAIAWSGDGRWLAAQTLYQDRQQVWIYHVSVGWGQPVKLEVQAGERLCLLGWAEVATATRTPQP